MCTKILPEFFQRFEKDLSQKIQTGKDPFLGLFADYLGSATKNLLLKELRSSSCPAENFIENLRYYPALISTLLIGALLEKFGQHGHFEVYPIFEELFGDSLQSTTTKQKLWKNFRWASLSLGLPVSHRLSGTHYMVDEYLYQAGLPLRYVENFTEVALRYSSRIGLPDEDDPEEIRLWQQGLVTRLSDPFPKTARKAVENDDGCYYTCIFTHLLTNPPADEDGLSIFEKRMRKAIQSGPSTARVFRSAIPQLVIRDLEYGVLLPAVEEATWKITVSYHDSDEETKIFTSYGEERFEPFGEELPADVDIENNSGFKWQYKVWEDEKNNRLLIFSQPDGKLVSRSSLAKKEIYLNPGNYRLLQRFPAAGDDGLEPMSEEPALYVREINLLPGSVIPISRGPATLQIKPHNIPTLNWVGDPLRGIKGNELYASENLQLMVSLPAEFLASDHDFELRFKSAELGDEIILEPEVEPNGQVNIDVASLWPAGFGQSFSRCLARADTGGKAGTLLL
ncbi:MAG: hypothetical protein BZ151_12550 [Desulfobacca sp. 4484_104]|nr:MAG: hypothetical protein BZ151_12550 [Desulfobacca sp. 4484_104]